MKHMVFDGHNDTLMDIFMDEAAPESFFAEQSDKHISYNKAVAGGLVGGLFAVFAGNQVIDSENAGQKVIFNNARRFADRALECLQTIAAISDGRFEIVSDKSRLQFDEQPENIKAVLHFEGAEAIAADLSNLDDYYGKGLRSAGIVWSRDNQFAHGVPIRFPSSADIGDGLTGAGRELVQGLNRRGILIDVSHMNMKGFFEVADLSSKPFVASHSCVHAITPSSRNLTDDQIRVIADCGGLVGINFAVQFLNQDGSRQTGTPLSLLLDHFCYIIDLAGVEHVAIGSDFDGCNVPDVIGDATGLQALMNGLKERGCNERELALIGRQNWQRLLASVWY